jgi:dihydrofolate reductase
MLNPTYIAIAAITIDGKIAKGPKHMSDWTSQEDKLFMRGLLSKCDVVVIGNNTYKTAIKPLSKRNCIVFSKSVDQPVKKSDNLLYVNPAKVNFKLLIKNLGYKKIALLGGAKTYSWFLENNLLDEIFLTIEPLAFGGGINLFSNEKIGDFKFKLSAVKKLNKKGSLLLHYKRARQIA